MKKIISITIGLLTFCVYSAQNNSQNTQLNFNNSTFFQKAPNTNVYLIPPKYFETDSTINGYIHKGSMATIQITEVPNVAIADFEKKMTEKYFISQGYIFKNKTNLKLDNGKIALLYFVQYKTEEFDYERIMFFVDSNEKMLWINVTYPFIMKKLLDNVIENSLKSVQ